MFTGQIPFQHNADRFYFRFLFNQPIFAEGWVPEGLLKKNFFKVRLVRDILHADALPVTPPTVSNQEAGL